MDLAELGGLEPAAPKLEVSRAFKFADIFFNNLFTDLAAGRQIRDAQDNVERAAQQVSSLGARLKSQVSQAASRLDGLEAERRQILSQRLPG